MKQAIVVGGGICGIVCSLLLAKKFERVLLIEKDATCGGLFRSYTTQEGYVFDYGAHISLQTGIANLDELLFRGVTEQDWHIFRHRKVGNFFQGQLNANSPNIDITRLDRITYLEALDELLRLETDPDSNNDLLQYILQMFGPILAREVFTPIMHKFCGTELKNLSYEALRVLGPTRVVALTPSATREIKKSSRYDLKFSFHNYREGASPVNYYYPKIGGIGGWVDLLMAQVATQKNIEIRTGCNIEAITKNGDQITHLKISDSPPVSCDLLVWTILPNMLSRHISPMLTAQPPAFRVTSLAHYVFDQPFLTDAHQLVCYDSSLTSFRTTLYSNIGGDELTPAPPHRCTIEFFSDTVPDSLELASRGHKELIRMSIVSDKAKILFQEVQVFPKAWPVMTPELLKNSEFIEKALQNECSNLLLAGKAKGHSFFMQDVLTEAYHAIAALP